MVEIASDYQTPPVAGLKPDTYVEVVCELLWTGVRIPAPPPFTGEESMKIACIADLHGYLPEELPEADVLVIAGDICPATDHSYEFQLEWLQGEFVPWAQDVSKKIEDIVMIAGNHDWIFEIFGTVGEFIEHDVDGFTYLQGYGTVLEHDGKEYKFYGTPYTPEFRDWAFNSSTEAMKRHSAAMPGDADVIITHGPPQLILDVPGFIDSTEHCGCKYVDNAIRRIKPKAHIFGHIHGARGIHKLVDTVFVNASYVDEQYEPHPEPIQVIEI